MSVRALRLLPLAALLAGVLVWFPGQADAVCAPPTPVREALAEAKVVFVGTVTETEDGGATATFLVEEIWSGPTLAPLVKVHGPDTASTEDVLAWREGGRYLVMPDLVGERLEDHPCSDSRPWTDDLAAFRPADARQPIDQAPTSGPPGDPPYALVFLLILVGGVVGGFLLLRRR